MNRISFGVKLTPNKTVKGDYTHNYSEDIYGQLTGQAFTVWRKSIRRGWRGNLTPPSTTLMTGMRISSRFKRGRSLPTIPKPHIVRHSVSLPKNSHTLTRIN
jgi:hypothetical protein